MKIAVFGIGSIGGWLTAALVRAGVSPTVVARGATLETLRNVGLCIEDQDGKQCIRVNAVTAAGAGPQDMVLVALKAQQFNASLTDLQSLLGPDTAVVSMMNGIPWWFFGDLAGPLRGCHLDAVDPAGRAAAAIAPRRALGGVVHASVRTLGPGQFRVNGVDKLILGEPDGSSSERLNWLAQTFERAAVPTLRSSDIRRDIWTKLWGNMNMNPLSALARASTRQLLDDPDVSELCLRMMTEMAAAGTRLGLALPADPRDRMAMTRKLGDFRPSMLQDIEAGRALEYEAQLGAVVEIARRLDVPAPFCASVLGLTRLLSRSV